jgi:hypothetical protein
MLYVRRKCKGRLLKAVLVLTDSVTVIGTGSQLKFVLLIRISCFHVSGACMTKMGFGYDDWIYWTPCTTGYNSSQITLWCTVVIFGLDTPWELFWLPTDILCCTPLYSFSSHSDLVLFCTTYIVSRRTHRTHHFLYSHIYNTIAY